MAFVAYNFASVLNVLPVGLTFFTSSISGNNIQLLWQTATESNSSYFEIEGSGDGTHFNSLGIREAAGNSSSKINYSFTDTNVETGVHYYRVRQIDKDGHFTYSKTITQVALVDKIKLSVYPNPVINNVLVTYANSAKEEVLSLYNSLGKLLWSKKIEPGTTETNLNVASYPAGGYIFQLNARTKQLSSVKFLIK